MTASRRTMLRVVALALVAVLAPDARAADIIKLGLSVPLSGAGSNWGRGADWLCKRAAQDVKDAGGVKVNGKVYNFECVAYDNKYNAAEGAKVAQTLLNRDGVKYIGNSIGTAPILALQSLSERQGALLFTVAWGRSLKGPKFPLTFTSQNTIFELLPALVGHVTQAHPQAKTIVLVNPNDATGHEAEPVSKKLWETAGVKVLSSDFYERGTTEFQPIAARLASLRPDIVNLGTSPPADAGVVFKELEVLGWKGVKIMESGTGTDGLTATAGPAAEGVYMGAAVTFDSASMPEHARKVNEAARAEVGESLNAIHIGSYNAVLALKAAMEKAQSVDAKVVAATLPKVSFTSFYGTESGFGGTEEYGSPQQMILPVFITRVENGKVVEKARIAPRSR